MFFLLHLCLSLGLIIEAVKERPHREVRMLHEDTVLLIAYSYVDIEGYGDVDESSFQDEYRCKLSVRSHKNWNELEKHGRLVSEYSKEAKESSFLFIAPRTEHYLFTIFEENSRPDKALQIHIYEGRKKDPRIFSSADSHARDVQNKMQGAIDYCNSINDIQRFDVVEDDEFKRCYRTMEKVVFYSVLFKVVTAASTFFFFNRKIREFYLSKKIIKE